MQRAEWTDNRILASLPQDERDLVFAQCDEVDLRLGDAIQEGGEPVGDLYFPLDAAISVMDMLDEHHIVEVMVIGNEGCSGTPLILDTHASTSMSMVDTGGRAVRIAASAMMDRLPRMPFLRAALTQYHSFQLRYAEITLRCSRIHAPAQRVAGWLKTHWNRIGLESFPITTAALAAKIGLPPQEAADVLEHLQRQGIVSRRYNKISLTDRAALDLWLCECFARVKSAIDDYLAGLADLTGDS
jgi:CRP-like cAMP-binding protein